MVKKYIARNTILSMSVVVDGKNVDVDFTPFSGRDGSGSSFSTDNEDLQNAIEHNYRFGNIIDLVRIDGMTIPEWNNAQNTKGTDEDSENEETGIKVNGVHVQISSSKDAIEYLSSNYNWKPKTRPTKKGINDAAVLFGVIFDWV